MKLENILHLNNLTFVFKAITKLSPIYFHNYFTPSSSVHRFGTRQANGGDLFNILKNNTLYGPQTVEYFLLKIVEYSSIFICIAVTARGWYFAIQSCWDVRQFWAWDVLIKKISGFGSNFCRKFWKVPDSG